MGLIDIWTADAAYIFSSAGTQLCRIGTRRFYKTNAGKAIVGAYKRTDGYQGPILVSTDPDCVKFTTENRVFDYDYTVSYDGITWYVSASDYFMPNSNTYAGPAIRLSGTYTTDQEAGLALLAAANATVTDQSEWDGDVWSRHETDNHGYPFIASANLPIVAMIPSDHATWIVSDDAYPRISMAHRAEPCLQLPTVYQEIQIYDANTAVSDFDHNGKCIAQPTSCSITEDLNGQYEMQMDLPIMDGTGWQDAVEHNVIKAQRQLFDIYRKSTSNDTRTVYARHVFYRLNSYFLLDARPTDLAGTDALNWILDHTYVYRGTAGMADRPPFTASSDIDDQHTAYYIKMSPTNAILGTDNCFAAIWGGELKRDNFDFTVNKRRGADNAFCITRGADMIAVSEEVDYSEYCPCIYWDATIDGAEDAMRGCAAYRQLDLPVQPMRYYNVSMDSLETQAETSAEVSRRVYQYMMEHCMPSINYTVEIVDLRGMDGYEDFVGLAAYDVGDAGTIYSDDIGIETVQQICSRTIDGITGEVLQVQLGNKKATLASGRPTVSKYVQDRVEQQAYAKNTWNGLSQRGITWDDLKSLSWKEAKGKVAIKID